MGGPSENPGEIPQISMAEYVTTMDHVDRVFDVHESRKDPIDVEYYGELEGWENDTHKFIHDIISARMALKLITQASIDQPSEGKKFLNSPDQVEYYSMYLIYFRENERIYINTTDPDMAREIHKVFFEVLIRHQTALEAVDWLIRESRYGKMKSPQDSSIPLVDIMSASSRKTMAKY